MVRYQRRGLLAAVGALVIAGGLLYWKSRADGVDFDDTQQEMQQLRSEMRDLKRDQAASLLLAAQRDGKDTSTAPPGRGPAPGEGQSAAAGSAGATQHSYTEEEIADDLDSRFEAEPFDAAWSNSATREATRALSTDLPEGTTLTKLECRSSLCRVDTLHDSLDSFRTFASTSLLGRERRIWNGGVSTMVRESSDTEVKAVTYIAKEGQSVPTLGAPPEQAYR